MRPRPTLARWAWAAAIAIAGILGIAAGCTTSDDRARAPSTTLAAVQDFVATRVRYDEAVALIREPIQFPLREIMLSLTENLALDRATWILRQPCMSEAGFEELPFAADPPAVLDEINWERRYLYIRLSEARQVGYGAPTVRDDAFHAYATSRERSQRALSGPELQAWDAAEQRCTKAARQEICGDLHADQQKSYCDRHAAIVNQDSVKSLTVARAAAAVQEATDLWSSCMHGKGYDYGSIDAAWAAGIELEAGDSIDLAIADTSCKDDSKLMLVWATIEAGVQAEIIEKNPERYDDIVRQKDELVRRIAGIIGDGA